MKYLIILAFLSSCTTFPPSPTTLWAETTDAKSPPEAQISYLKCDFLWPNQSCLEDAWKKYGAPVIEEKSGEEWRKKAREFIKAIQVQGAGYLLKEKGYQCTQVKYFDNMLFSKSKLAICDSGIRYKIKYKHEWHIELIAN